MVLGIAGKSGVGKHVAADFFAQRDWKVLDADKIAHKLYRPYLRVWRDVVDRFGEEILTKNDLIDRQKLRQVVFGSSDESKQALKDLNAIIHPELKRYLKDEVYFLKKRKKNVVVVAALWEEIGLFEICDKVLHVKAGKNLTFERVKKRDGTSEDMFEMVYQSQPDPSDADFIVVNEGDVRGLHGQLVEVLKKMAL